MIRTLLRRPEGAEVVADALRAAAAIGIIVAWVGWGPMSGLSLLGAFIAMLLPRALGVRPSVDIAFCAITLAAVWSSVLQIYITTPWWDLPMHFLTNGVYAALCYMVLVRFEVIADAETLPHPVLSAAVMTTALGLSLGVFWELFEWFGHTFIDDGIYVGYEDSLGDLVSGGLGSLFAGLSMRYLTARSQVVGERPPSPALG